MEKIIIARNVSMHGGKVDERRKEDVWETFCISAQQDQDIFLDYDIHVS